VVLAALDTAVGKATFRALVFTAIIDAANAASNLILDWLFVRRASFPSVVLLFCSTHAFVFYVGCWFSLAVS
jgi:hypothetical protein